jgi:multidrug efflux pump subunit AcrA (membrane-fusion protein)
VQYGIGVGAHAPVADTKEFRILRYPGKRMKAFTEKLIHYLTLIGVTIIAAWVMWAMTSKSNPDGKQEQLLRPLPDVARPKAPVVVVPMEVQLHEILATFTGKIHPWETHHVSFEVAGRVHDLGSTSARGSFQGIPLDEGDSVVAGQVLARLDDRVYRALKSEASARVEQASSDLQRAQRIRTTNPSALSDSELQGYATDLALARAQFEVALKNLEDATLTSPVKATISRRFINPGESVGANQSAFELVENEEVLLIVEVPEYQVRDLEKRMREVRANRAQASGSQPDAPALQGQTGIEDQMARELRRPTGPPTGKEPAPQIPASDNRPGAEDTIFRAYVELKGRDRMGKPWPALEGEVYRIAEVADPRTSLFQVEIRLPNKDKLLRPGMIATTHIVLARIPAYTLPEMAVIFRAQRAFLFRVEKQPAEMEMMYWNVGPTEVYRAKRVELTTWIEQGQKILIPVEPASPAQPANSVGQNGLHWIVVRGQHRLADSQLVRIMNRPSLTRKLPPTQQVAEFPGQNTKHEIRNPKQIRMFENQNPKTKAGLHVLDGHKPF